jgi:hypothetical protein
MTQSANLKRPAQLAVDKIVKGQSSNGSWDYHYRNDGDTSIVGWQIQALRTAKLAQGLIVPEKTFRNTEDFLDEASSDGGAKYSYRTKGMSPTLSAVGLYCRQNMGWGRDHKALVKGVEFLKQRPPVGNGDIYYATQVVFHSDGEDWSDFWYPKMRDAFVKTQERAGEKKGS